jgi:amidophosphoribosyltransferase
MAMGHNGNLVNAPGIRKELGEAGAIFQSTNDSEVIVHLMAQSRRNSFIDRAVAALSQVKGAYSIVLMSENELIAARDPNGFRPLCLGKVDGGYIVASESCVMNLVEAEYIRELEPGELLLINKYGMKSFFPFPKSPTTQCVFEHIYFSRPDSHLFGQPVYSARKHMGRALARDTPVDADVVVPVPDSGVISAMGYSEESGIPFQMGLIRNHYVGRTFIEPQSQIRNFGVKIKLNAVESVIRGKRVIIIDDSIVRGTTSKKIVKMLREVGAKEIHVRISSPPTTHSCFYGIDTPTKGELIASNMNLEQTREYLGADSLHYLDLEKMLDVFGDQRGNFCSACFNGCYPIEVEDPNEGSPQLDLFE